MHEGRHEAIVSEALFDAVQAKLEENRVTRAYGTAARAPALLTGLLFDEHDQKVTPTHANKPGRRYRYYASQSLIGRRERQAKGIRVPASDVDGIVLKRLASLLTDRSSLHDLLTRQDAPPQEHEGLMRRAGDVAATLQVLAAHEQRALALQVIVAVTILPNSVEIVLDDHGLLRLIEAGRAEVPEEALANGISPALSDPAGGSARAGSGGCDSIRLCVPATTRRAGMEMRLVLEGKGAPESHAPQPSLVRLIAQAHRLRRMLPDHRDRSIGELAEAAGLSDAYFARIVRLGFLAPDLAEAIIEGTQPIELTANRLAKLKTIPMEWREQRALLGFAARG